MSSSLGDWGLFFHLAWPTRPHSFPFPSDTFERPIKFPLLVDDPGYFAINKPAGLASFQHDWNQGKPDISMALRRELLNEKPQLKKLGIEGLFRAYKLDAELSGVLLYAKTPEWEELLKNATGCLSSLTASICSPALKVRNNR